MTVSTRMVILFFGKDTVQPVAVENAETDKNCIRHKRGIYTHAADQNQQSVIDLQKKKQ